MDKMKVQIIGNDIVEGIMGALGGNQYDLPELIMALSGAISTVMSFHAARGSVDKNEGYLGFKTLLNGSLLTLKNSLNHTFEAMDKDFYENSLKASDKDKKIIQ